ncbi:MAG: Uma2 family endonuclease [Planctomycetia bacterium]|nr:Uma2 family endonuclease [Planctomycetia bacterium]
MSTAVLHLQNEVHIPADVYTLRKFRAWAHSRDFPETGKISFISGHIEVDMSPENMDSHNPVKGEVFATLLKLVRKHDLGRVWPDGALLVNHDADLATEPDVVFSGWKSLQSGKVRIAPFGTQSTARVELVGTPDLVVEVVSPSSVTKDTDRLFKGYFAAGIEEYWLIDARGDSVSFEIFSRSRRGYVPVPVGRDGYRLSPLFGRKFRFVRRTDRLGDPDYRLLIR